MEQKTDIIENLDESNSELSRSEIKVKKSFKQQWEEVDFVLLTKFAFLGVWSDLKSAVTGTQHPRVTNEDYLEAFYAKKNSKN